MPIRQTLKYINSSDRELRITLEPWADQYIVFPGEEVEILVQANGLVGVLEFEQISDGMIIYGYPDCVVYALRDGIELAPSDQR